MTTPIATPETRLRATVRLGDLGVARENLRFGEPADDDVPALAASIRAAGVLLPLTVRAARGRKERPWMALDGRRRLLALDILREAGEIDDDFPIEVFEETDLARQAAASVLTNTAAPVHVADVIVAIGRMLKAKLTPRAIAGALGQDEIDVKRLAALSALPDVALDALRQGRISLRQARLLARLADPGTQVELAEQALNGHAFQEWRITERLNGEAATVRDRRCTLVAPDVYVAAGGRVETDLFGELPARLLDPAVLSQAWEARAARLGAELATDGIAVSVSAEPAGGIPDGLEMFYESQGWDLAGEARETWLAARDLCREAGEAVRAVDATTDEAAGSLIAWCRARVALDAASEPGRQVSAVTLVPHTETGLEVRCYGPAAIVEDEAPELDGAGGADAPDEPASNVVAFAPPEAEDGGQALNRARTEIATLGLVRALADAPRVALTALTARLFDSVAVPGRGDGTRSALAIRSDSRRRADDRSIETLDGDVRRRLAERREAWEASGQSLIGWVSGLSLDDQLSLLALSTAMSVDLGDVRTGRMRPPARAEAAEIAALCEADIRAHWTPDAEFLRPHTKAQLIAMLEAMDVDLDAAGPMTKTDLVDRVAEEAEARAWAPASVLWDAAGGADPETAEPVDPEPEE